MSRYKVFAICAFAALFSISIQAVYVHAQFSFTPLGMYEATGVSGDGSIVVGYSYLPPRWAYRWTAETGTEPMNFWFDRASGREVVPMSISDDGSVIVGAYYTHVGAQPQAFRWTAEEGLDPFFLGVNHFNSIARDVSADGSVIVGDGRFWTAGPFFRWTASDGLTDIREALAYAVSADGRVIVGGAYRWSANEGPMVVPSLPGADVITNSWDVSADGSIVVGSGVSPVDGQLHPNSEAFRWTAETGTVGLGDLPGGNLSSAALAVSSDGSVIVGHGETGDELVNVQATLWTDELGIVALKDYLVSNGVTNLDGWRLVHATGVSADGRTIIGDGINPLGEAEAWAATIPEPSTWVLLGVAVFGLPFAARLKSFTR
jgi:uncharacterized membrane protein